MKTLYTFILAVLLSYTALAQNSTIFHENFNVSSYDVTLGGTWSRTNASPIVEGTYVVATSTTATITKTITVSGYSSVTLSWFERAEILNNKNLTRSLRISDNNDKVYSTAYSTPSEISNAVWSNASVTITGLESSVTTLTLTWTVNRNNNQSHRFAIDDVVVSGVAVKPSITFPTTALTFDAVLGGESVAKSYTLIGNGLTSSSKVIITAPARFKLSLDGGVYSDQLELTPSTEGKISQEIFVKYYGAASGPHKGAIMHEYGVLTAFMSVTGITAPSVTVPQSPIILESKIGAAVVKSFSLSGTNLVGALTVSSDNTLFTISVDGIDYQTSTRISPVGGNISATLYIKYESTNTGTHRGTISYASSGLATETTSLEGITTEMAVAPLPVELATFNGQSSKGFAQLVWSTATEQNNEKFVVERSLEGKHFDEIGEVKGRGNSSTKITYNFTDKAPVGGTNYYRLRQVDFDGTATYSNIIALEVTGKGAEIAVYPTVANSAVIISLPNVTGNTAINVVDITGRTVATFTSVTEREIELLVHSFRNGVYFVKVTDGQNQLVQRFIKQ